MRQMYHGDWRCTHTGTVGFSLSCLDKSIIAGETSW